MATTDGVGRRLDRLRTDVARKEAVNDAKRGVAPVLTRSSTNALARQWSRLESLKKHRDQPAGQDSAKAKLPVPTTPASTPASTDAATPSSTP